MTSYDPRILATLMTAAVIEEVIFRLGIQEHLLRRAESPQRTGTAMLSGPSVANLLTASVFGLAHGLLRSWTLAFATLPAALALGWLYQRRRRVGPCIALHALLNLAWFGIAPWWQTLSAVTAVE